MFPTIPACRCGGTCYSQTMSSTESPLCCSSPLCLSLLRGLPCSSGTDPAASSTTASKTSSSTAAAAEGAPPLKKPKIEQVSKQLGRLGVAGRSRCCGWMVMRWAGGGEYTAGSGQWGVDSSWCVVVAAGYMPWLCTCQAEGGACQGRLLRVSGHWAVLVAVGCAACVKGSLSHSRPLSRGLWWSAGGVFPRPPGWRFHHLGTTYSTLVRQEGAKQPLTYLLSCSTSTGHHQPAVSISTGLSSKRQPISRAVGAASIQCRHRSCCSSWPP